MSLREISEVTTDSAQIIPVIMKEISLRWGLDYVLVLQENYTRRGAFLQYMVKGMRIGYKKKKVLDKVHVLEPSF